MKKVLRVMTIIIMTIILLFSFNHVVYADMIVDDDILDVFINYLDIDNTAAPNSPSIKEVNKAINTFLITGGIVIITIGVSIIVFIKSNKKN